MSEYVDLGFAAIRAQDLKRQGKPIRGFAVTQTTYDMYRSKETGFKGEIAVGDQLGRDVFYVLPLSEEQAQKFGFRSDAQIAYSHLTLEELKRVIG